MTLRFHEILSSDETNLISQATEQVFEGLTFFPSPSIDDCITRLNLLIHHWHMDGKIICLTQGCYDNLHPNHYLKLQLCRQLAYKWISARMGVDQAELMQKDVVRLVVSLDSNLNIRNNSKKLYREIRPLDNWAMRAFRLLTLCERTREGTIPIVNAVAIHDEVAYRGSAFESAFSLARNINHLDMWFVSEENSSLIQNAHMIGEAVQIITTPRFSALTTLFDGDFTSSSALLEKIIQKLRECTF